MKFSLLFAVLLSAPAYAADVYRCGGSVVISVRILDALSAQVTQEPAVFRIENPARSERDVYGNYKISAMATTGARRGLVSLYLDPAKLTLKYSDASGPLEVPCELLR